MFERSVAVHGDSQGLRVILGDRQSCQTDSRCASARNLSTLPAWVVCWRVCGWMTVGGERLLVGGGGGLRVAGGWQ